MSRNFEILSRGVARPDVQGTPAARRHRPQPNGNRRHSAPASAADAEIRKLVQSVFIYPCAEKPPAVVVFCGVDEGVGCTWVCARTGELLAENVPGRVCIVDGNLRSPSLSRHFDIEAGVGFAEAMQNGGSISDFVHATVSSHLRFMSAGSFEKPPNGGLNPERLHGRIADLRKEFDYILIDAPPVSAYPDAALLAHLADGAVLVVKSNATRRESARSAKQTLEAARVPILGAVLSQRTYPIPEALYRRL